MPIQDFELYHGAVLTKVMRTDPKPTLRLVERDHTDAWGSYRVNMDVVLHIKYATAGKSSKRSPGTLKWLFGFPLSEATSLAKHPATFLALVCGKAKGSTEGEIALIEPDELRARSIFRPKQAKQSRWSTSLANNSASTRPGTTARCREIGLTNGRCPAPEFVFNQENIER